MAKGVAAALHQHLAEDGWAVPEQSTRAFQVHRDDGLTMNVVTLERVRWPLASTRIARAVLTLVRGMSDPETLHALAIGEADLPTVLTVPGRVWMLLGVRVYVVDAHGGVHRQVIV